MLYTHEEDSLELYSSVAAADVVDDYSYVHSKNNLKSRSHYRRGVEYNGNGIHKIIPLVNSFYDQQFGGSGEVKATRPFTVTLSSWCVFCNEF